MEGSNQPPSPGDSSFHHQDQQQYSPPQLSEYQEHQEKQYSLPQQQQFPPQQQQQQHFPPHHQFPPPQQQHPQQQYYQVHAQQQPMFSPSGPYPPGQHQVLQHSVQGPLIWIEPQDKSPSPALAALINGLIPLHGFGYLVYGQNDKALVCLIVSLITRVSYFFLFLLGWIPIFGQVLLVVGFWTYIIMVVFALPIMYGLDAYRMAQRLREGFPIATSEISVSLLFHMWKPFLTSAFVTGSPTAPPEWFHRMSRVNGIRAPFAQAE